MKQTIGLICTCGTKTFFTPLGVKLLLEWVCTSISKGTYSRRGGSGPTPPMAVYTKKCEAGNVKREVSGVYVIQYVWDTDSHKSEDFFLNPICILYIIVCLYMLFFVQSIQIKYV